MSSPLFTINDFKHAVTSDETDIRAWLLERWAVLDAAGVGPQGDTAWIYLPNQAQREEILSKLFKLDPKACPLWGVPFAIKDNIDHIGWPTTAACPGYAYTAQDTATVVQALQDAGAVLMGKTNLDQFATGLVGVRSPYGWVRNAFSDEHISGGSSSGSASVVARGLVAFALGTDTAGSGRIPAGFNNLVGMKSTPGALSIKGVVPACATLDCVSILALNVEDAATVFRVAQNFSLEKSPTETSFHEVGTAPVFDFPTQLRVGIPEDPYFEDEHYRVLFEQAVQHAKELGAHITTFNMSALSQIAELLYEGPWVAERYSAAGATIEANLEGVDQTVATVIKKAEKFSAVDAFEALYKVRLLAVEAQALWRDFDVMLLPTAPCLPTYEQVTKDPIKQNSALGTYTNFVNLLDWAAIAVPASFTPSGLPFGVTFVGPKGKDEALLALGSRWEKRVQLPIGKHLPLARTLKGGLGSVAMPKSLALAVVGAHLTGMPLNHQLQSIGARLREQTTTSANYRLFALPNTTPPKPGLTRVENKGVKIVVEVYDVPIQQVGTFLANIPAPLGLGSVELDSGQWVTGFICEPIGILGALDISHLGGWRAYIASLK
jgi:allophanate hydrolase